MALPNQSVLLYENLCDLLQLTPYYGAIEVNEFSEFNNLAEKDKGTIFAASLQVFSELILALEENPKLDRFTIDELIAKLDIMLGEQLDEILHHEEFKRLESLWRSLEYLVSRVDFKANTSISILNVSKEDLSQDFSEAIDITQSGLYQHLYVKEYDMPGGKPVSIIISDYEFTSKEPDINLLHNIAKVASSAHCPFIAGVGAKFFNKATMAEVALVNELSDYMQRVEFIKWNNFRLKDESRYIGLVLPKFLLRLPYGEYNSSREINYYEEINSGQDEDYLWGMAAFPFAVNIARSFSQYGWTVNIRGPESGGKVENLPIHYYDAGFGLESKIPTQILIPESRELELAELGFIPFSYYKNSDTACFFSANSVHKPQQYMSAEATANSQINAKLPYVLLACRLGHYLKVLQRENIGSTKDRVMLEQELNKWLNTLVTQMPNPGAELLALHPLKEGLITVENIPGNPGRYKINLHAVPHFQVEGMDVKLCLVSDLPGQIK